MRFRTVRYRALCCLGALIWVFDFGADHAQAVLPTPPSVLFTSTGQQLGGHTYPSNTGLPYEDFGDPPTYSEIYPEDFGGPPTYSEIYPERSVPLITNSIPLPANHDDPPAYSDPLPEDSEAPPAYSLYGEDEPECSEYSYASETSNDSSEYSDDTEDSAEPSFTSDGHSQYPAEVPEELRSDWVTSFLEPGHPSEPTESAHSTSTDLPPLRSAAVSGIANANAAVLRALLSDDHAAGLHVHFMPESATPQPMVVWSSRSPDDTFLDGFLPPLFDRFPTACADPLQNFGRSIRETLIDVAAAGWGDDARQQHITTGTANAALAFPTAESECGNFLRSYVPERMPTQGVLYRYEILAPAGVDVDQSFAHDRAFLETIQQRFGAGLVLFPGGVKPHHIRSAWEIEHSTVVRVWMNMTFDPRYRNTPGCNIRMFSARQPDEGREGLFWEQLRPASTLQ